MLLWIIPYLHICTIAPITFLVGTQRSSVSMATMIQPIGGRVNWTNHGGFFLHRSISVGRSRSRLWSLGLLLLHWILRLFFWADIRWRSSLCDLRNVFWPRTVLDPWISPTSVPLGFYPCDVISVHSSSWGLLNFHTVLSSNSPTYTVLPSGVTVISWGSWNPWKNNQILCPWFLFFLRLLPPAYVVRREGTVFTGVCLLTFRGVPLSRSGWGVTPSQVQVGRGVPPSQVQVGGYPLSRWGGVWRAVCLLRSRRRTFLLEI